MQELQFTIKYNQASLIVSVVAVVDGKPKNIELSGYRDILQLQFARLTDGLFFNELDTALKDVENGKYRRYSEG